MTFLDFVLILALWYMLMGGVHVIGSMVNGSFQTARREFIKIEGRNLPTWALVGIIFVFWLWFAVRGYFPKKHKGS